jgi:hypothetical protein
MVKHSEALLLDQYHEDQIVMAADRLKREEQQTSFFTLRPELREGDTWRQDRGDPGEWLSFSGTTIAHAFIVSVSTIAFVCFCCLLYQMLNPKVALHF